MVGPRKRLLCGLKHRYSVIPGEFNGEFNQVRVGGFRNPRVIPVVKDFISVDVCNTNVVGVNVVLEAVLLAGGQSGNFNPVSSAICPTVHQSVQTKFPTIEIAHNEDKIFAWSPHAQYNCVIVDVVDAVNRTGRRIGSLRLRWQYNHGALGLSNTNAIVGKQLDGVLAAGEALEGVVQFGHTVSRSHNVAVDKNAHIGYFRRLRIEHLRCTGREGKRAFTRREEVRSELSVAQGIKNVATVSGATY